MGNTQIINKKKGKNPVPSCLKYLNTLSPEGGAVCRSLVNAALPEDCINVDCF